MSRKKKKKQERASLDVRNSKPFFANYDLYGPESATSPGQGLYNGPMDRYRSVTDFLNHKRKKKMRRLAFLMMLNNQTK